MLVILYVSNKLALRLLLGFNANLCDMYSINLKLTKLNITINRELLPRKLTYIKYQYQKVIYQKKYQNTVVSDLLEVFSTKFLL